MHEFSTDGHFDTSAAIQERLAWRLGGKEPTERALGLDENHKRQVASMIGNITMADDRPVEQ